MGASEMNRILPADSLSGLPERWTLGGTSGLVRMFSVADTSRSASGPGLYFGRRWSWIIAGLLATVLYALVFARTVR
jgi:hypothetical protein